MRKESLIGQNEVLLFKLQPGSISLWVLYIVLVWCRCTNWSSFITDYSRMGTSLWSWDTLDYLLIDKWPVRICHSFYLSVQLCFLAMVACWNLMVFNGYRPLMQGMASIMSFLEISHCLLPRSELMHTLNDFYNRWQTRVLDENSGAW